MGKTAEHKNSEENPHIGHVPLQIKNELCKVWQLSGPWISAEKYTELENK